MRAGRPRVSTAIDAVAGVLGQPYGRGTCEVLRVVFAHGSGLGAGPCQAHALGPVPVHVPVGASLR